jgi:hypothetical protein
MRPASDRRETLPDVKERLATLGLEPVGTTPEAAAALFRAEARGGPR